MLFYESAKCLHGRMKAFRGDYYGSIFLHYRPVDRGLWSYDVEVRVTRYAAAALLDVYTVARAHTLRESFLTF